MSDSTIDDRALLKARFSNLTNPLDMTPPPLPEDRRAIATDRMSPNQPVMRQGHDQIRLKIRRNQASSRLSGAQFTIHFIAELSPDALQAVKHYRFGKTVLYQKPLELKLSFNMLLALWRVFWLWITRSRWQITVDDLAKGRTVKCRDIIEVLEVEKDIRAAALIFADVLRAASFFGGEEVVEL